MSREPAEKLVLDLLTEYWDSGNSYGLTPKITYGWFNEAPDVPQVTVPQADESTANGGETGYSGIDPSTGDPTQTYSGTVTAHVWSRKDDLDTAGTNNPRQYNGQAAEEIRRIAKDNANKPTNPKTGNTPVDTLAYLGKTPGPDEDDVPAVFHYVVTVGYTLGPV